MLLPELNSDETLKIAKALADTEYGFTGSELSRIIPQYGFKDVSPNETKYKRLFNDFAEHINKVKSTKDIYDFIKKCFNPVIGFDNTEKYKKRLFGVNQVLMLKGLEITDSGEFINVKKAKTLSEVEQRTKNLKSKLLANHTHAFVLKCCKEEWLTEDYFHAVHEAAKSLCDRIREMSGLNTDGTNLITTAFSIKNPYIALNTLRTESEKNQQNGLKEMLLGIVHMIRNVTAHELRIRWDIKEDKAIEILGQISFLHNYLDVCTKVPKI